MNPFSLSWDILGAISKNIYPNVFWNILRVICRLANLEKIP